MDAKVVPIDSAKEKKSDEDATKPTPKIECDVHRGPIQGKYLTFQFKGDGLMIAPHETRICAVCLNSIVSNTMRAAKSDPEFARQAGMELGPIVTKSGIITPDKFRPH